MAFSSSATTTLAVALPDALIVPVIRDADRLGLLDLARTVNDLALRARSKSLRSEDVRDGTFTLNNTGAIGSIQGMAIINPPGRDRQHREDRQAGRRHR